ESGEVAASYYESTADTAKFYGARIAESITGERLLREGAETELEDLVQSKQHEYNLGVVEIFGANGEELVSGINPEIPAASFSRPDPDLVRAALRGEAGWHVDEVGSGDVVRAAVPIPSTLRKGKTAGAVVVNVLIPFSQARK